MKTLFNVALTIMLYAFTAGFVAGAIRQVIDGRWEIATLLLGAALACFLLGQTSLYVSRKHIKGTRQWATGGGRAMQFVLKSLPAHPAARDDVVTIPLDDDFPVKVSTSDLWYELIESKSKRGVLSWQSCVKEHNMPMNTWRAMRIALETSGAAKRDKSGALTLLCSPWEAVEKVQATYSVKWWFSQWITKKRQKSQRITLVDKDLKNDD